MAAGLGFKEFTTGDVLTAADANGYLASQVVMVFASAAARTSAIASPQEGMMSYLKDTNSTEYYSGSAWVAIGGSPDGNGFELISTTSFTSVASQAISPFSATYRSYRIIIEGTGTYDTLIFRLRDGSTNSTTGYASYVNRYFTSNATQTAANSNGAAFELNTAGNQFGGIIDLINPGLAKKTDVNSFGTTYDTGASRAVNTYQGGVHTIETAYSGIDFIMSSGTMTGVVSVWGLVS